MSVTIEAYTVVGIKIKREKIFKKKKVRACKHKTNERKNFCSECGKKTWTTEIVPCINIKEKGCKYLFGGYEVLFSEDFECEEKNAYIYIGIVARDNDYIESPIESKIDIKEIERLKEKLEKLLKPYKLWDEKGFAIWTISWVSY